MSRYIDADALRDKLYEADAVTMRGVAIINNEPTVDAVTVVRCGECKHMDYCDIYAHVKDADFFCKAGWMDLYRGERKDGADDVR